MATNISDNSVYDLITHCPIPTIKYIKDVSGLDLVAGGFAIVGSIEARVKMLTLNAKLYLFSRKIQQTKKVMEYLIATQEEWRKAFEYYAVVYIFNSLLGEDMKEVDQTIQGSLLSAKYFKANMITEVDNSTLEW